MVKVSASMHLRHLSISQRDHDLHNLVETILEGNVYRSTYTYDRCSQRPSAVYSHAELYCIHKRT